MKCWNSRYNNSTFFPPREACSLALVYWRYLQLSYNPGGVWGSYCKPLCRRCRCQLNRQFLSITRAFLRLFLAAWSPRNSCLTTSIRLISPQPAPSHRCISLACRARSALSQRRLGNVGKGEWELPNRNHSLSSCRISRGGWITRSLQKNNEFSQSTWEKHSNV